MRERINLMRESINRMRVCVCVTHPRFGRMHVLVLQRGGEKSDETVRTEGNIALIYSQLENSDQPVKNAYDIAVPQGTAYDSTAVQLTMALLSEF